MCQHRTSHFGDVNLTHPELTGMMCGHDVSPSRWIPRWIPVEFWGLTGKIPRDLSWEMMEDGWMVSPFFSMGSPEICSPEVWRFPNLDTKLCGCKTWRKKTQESLAPVGVVKDHWWWLYIPLRRREKWDPLCKWHIDRFWNCWVILTTSYK